MVEPFTLATTFLNNAPSRVTGADDVAALEALLRRAWDTARAPWPRVAVPPEVFVRHLSLKLSSTELAGPVAGLLEQLVLPDLYLACACGQEVPGALQALEHHYLGKVPQLLGYLRLPEPILDDVCQLVRIHLLVGTAESRPRLMEYTGRGALLSWLRVIAVRMALKQGGVAREVPEENVLTIVEALSEPGTNAELDLIKRRYHREFRQAVREAVISLTRDQRHLLRLHFIDRLSTTEMGPLFRVNQSTISRWIKSARHTVFEGTKSRLKERLRLSSGEFDSLLAAIESHFDEGFSQVLDDDDDDDDDEGT
ncbi:RNA polymerase sigma-70 factor [Stigmatella aurantiaca]|uniref:RNA polymerase sigma-70 factor n=1 Tax=Stigmatella aurantiaca TaxID=41 RepID=A0A1H7RS66_STIAU|nr:sigma-70 family RNA polymerase sigma factor [Stigmatella aurantiaca]SEL63046.1 RNA polymerase sigma-70 factor [Stigmatella aurantiaca]